MIVPSRYRPPFASERLLKPTASGFNGCRLSAAWSGIAVATLGESTMTPTGNVKGTAGRRADLRKMLQGTGEPNRDGFNQSHVAGYHAAVGQPAPDIFSGSFEKLWGDKNAAYTIAGHPRGMTGTKIMSLASSRGWSNVSHELLLLHNRKSDSCVIYDPMHPQSGSYRGDRVPKAEIRRFMTNPAVGIGGALNAERYPVGGWTAERKTKRRLESRIDRITAEFSKVEARLRARIAELENGVPPDCATEVEAAKKGVLDAIASKIQSLRS